MAYGPLPSDSTRVLHLAPGASGSPLSGSLHTTRIKEVLIWRRTGHEVFERQHNLRVQHLERKGRWDSREESRPPIATFAAGTSWPVHIDGYEAVSYTWGEPDLTHEIRIGQKKLRITKSLHAALQHFGYTDLPRRLWIDQICINQIDLDERAAQVAIMADIYTAATRVLVWTGSGSKADALAFATMQNGYGVTWFGKFSLQSLGARLSGLPHCRCCRQVFQLAADPGLAGLEAIADFVKRPYFERLWVVQETALEPKDRIWLFAGYHCVSWLSFDSTVQHLNAIMAPAGCSPSTLLSRDPLLNGLFWARKESIAAKLKEMHEVNCASTLPLSFSPSSMLSGLVTFSVRSCRDDRDRIFALRRVYGMDDIVTLRPDYRQRTEVTFRRAILTALRAIDQKQIIDADTWNAGSGDLKAMDESRRRFRYARAAILLFTLAGTFTDAATNALQLPSWVPDLSALSGRSQCKLHQWYNKPHAGPGEPYQMKRFAFFLNEDDHLSVRGALYATIVAVLSDSQCPRRYSADEHSDEGFLETVTVLLLRWYCTCTTFLQSQIGSAALTRLNLGELLRCDAAQRHWADISPEDFIGYIHSTGLEAEFPDLNNLEKVFDDLKFFTAHTFSHEYDNGRLLCIVRIDREDTIRIGWVPPSASVGDRVCYVGGIPFPVILREIDSSQRRYSVQGDAWFVSRDGSTEMYPHFAFRYPDSNEELRGDGFHQLLAAEEWYQARAEMLHLC